MCRSDFLLRKLVRLGYSPYMTTCQKVTYLIVVRDEVPRWLIHPMPDFDEDEVGLPVNFKASAAKICRDISDAYGTLESQQLEMR